MPILEQYGKNGNTTYYISVSETHALFQDLAYYTFLPAWN